MDSGREDSDCELYSKNSTILNILSVECSDTDNESDQKYNSHASSPIAENRTDITAKHQRPPSWRDFAQLPLKHPKEMRVIYFKTLTQQRKEHTVDFA